MAKIAKISMNIITTDDNVSNEEVIITIYIKYHPFILFSWWSLGH
jgi:hypothetical protein